MNLRPASSRAALVAMCLLWLAASAYADTPWEDSLRKARRLVEQKEYLAAINEYTGIQEHLRQDPGLLIEWARVYTYADKHPEAIALFEEARKADPAKGKEILRELADQYNWNGQQKEALREYDALLAVSPDNKEALLGKAEILGWQDKLEESLALLRRAQAADPADQGIRCLVARTYVWQGFHRKGIAEYRAVLQDQPENLDALEGMAFALHWDGQDSQASGTLEKLLLLNPDRREAKKLQLQIRNAQQPSIEGSGYFTTDSNAQTVTSSQVRAGMHLDPGTVIYASHERQLLRKKGARSPYTAADRSGAGLSKDLNEGVSLDAFIYKSDFTKTSFDPFTANTWMTFKPGDVWRVYLAYDRETFQDNDALYYHITGQGPSVSVDLRPDRFWYFNLKYKRRYLSDDNRQNEISSKAEYRLMHKPYVKLYYNYYYSQWGEADLNHGYFNPIAMHAHSLGAYAGGDLNPRLFAEAQASGGYEFQHKADPSHHVSNHPTCFAAAGLTYRLFENWGISLRGEYFTTWPDRGQSSYSDRKALLSIRYNFGSGQEKAPGSGQPSRATAR